MVQSVLKGDRPFTEESARADTEHPPRAAATERVAQNRMAPAQVQTPNGQVVMTIDTAKLGFKPAGTDTRFCKFGFYGAQGSGKTTTATWLAREIARREGKKSVYMIDSEGGSDFVANVLEKQGMRLEVIKTREFKRLVQITEALHDSGEILLLDSVTHFWNDVIESFLAQKSYKLLEMKDFSTLYDTWRLFTRPYVTSKLHYLVCARMGWEYATTVNERGKLEFYKADTKFKAGEQFGHEPALLIYMQQVDNAEAVERLHHAKDKAEKNKAIEQLATGSSLNFVATIEKDRARLLMGRQFMFTPTEDDEANAQAVVKEFDPVITWHLKNATHSGFEGGPGGSASMFASEADERAYFKRRERKEILLGEIESTFTRWFPSTSPKDRQAAVIVLEKVLGVRGWASVKALDLDVLEAVIAPQADGPSVLERTCIEEREKLDNAAPAKDKKTGPTALPE